MALSRAFGTPFYVAGIFKFCQDMLGFVGPQLLSYLITFVSDKSQPLWHGYALAAGLLFAAELQSLLLHQVCSHPFCTGRPTRGGLS